MNHFAFVAYRKNTRNLISGIYSKKCFAVVKVNDLKYYSVFQDCHAVKNVVLVGEPAKVAVVKSFIENNANNPMWFDEVVGLIGTDTCHIVLECEDRIFSNGFITGEQPLWDFHHYNSQLLLKGMGLKEKHDVLNTALSAPGSWNLPVETIIAELNKFGILRAQNNNLMVQSKSLTEVNEYERINEES